MGASLGALNLTRRVGFACSVGFVSAGTSPCVCHLSEIDVEEEPRAPVVRARSEALPAEERRVAFPERSRDRARSRVRSEVTRPHRDATADVRGRARRRDGPSADRRERSPLRSASRIRRERDPIPDAPRARSPRWARSPSPNARHHSSKVLGWLSQVSGQCEYVFHRLCFLVTVLTCCS